MKNDLIANFNVNKDKIIVIHNPINEESIYKMSIEPTVKKFDQSKINLIFVGRLEKIKGCELILGALALLDRKYNLTIVGDGSKKKELICLSKNLQIEDRVFFVGFQSNPYSFIQNSDYLLIASLYEGFPNVVIEANLLGKPVFGFNCPGGINEIINNGVNGYLVENRRSEDLANVIEEYSKKGFNSNIIIKKYESCFNEI